MVFSGERERTINWHSILKDLEAKLDHTKVQGGLMWNSTTTKIGRKKIKEEKVYGPLETNIRHNAYISSHSFHFFSSLRQTEQSLFLPTFPKWVELCGKKEAILPRETEITKPFMLIPMGFMIVPGTTCKVFTMQEVNFLFC